MAWAADINGALGRAVTALQGAGFASVSVNPEELVADPGCVWVVPEDIRDRTLDGGGTLMAHLYLIVANVENAPALLDDSLEGVLELFVLADEQPAIDLRSAVTLPANPTNPLPAYRVAVDLDL